MHEPLSYVDAVKAEVDAVKAEHREIGGMVRRIRESLRAPVAAGTSETAQHLLRQIEELQKYLQRHFRQEEQGGYLDEALAHAGHLAKEVARLMGEHTALAAKLDQVVATAQACVASPACWTQLREETRAMLTAVLEHEAGEHRILNKGLHIDPELPEL